MGTIRRLLVIRNTQPKQQPFLILTSDECTLKRSKTRRKRIVITGVTDMEDKAASAAMVNALASRVESVIKELGLTAKVRVGRDARIHRPKHRRGHRVVAAGASEAPGLSAARRRSGAVDRPGPGSRTGLEESRR